MAFVLPTFNLSCDIYNGPWVGKTLRLSVMGNLAFGRRVQQGPGTWFEPPAGPTTMPVVLLLPPLTDVRGKLLVPEGDIVEAPAGSNRWYVVESVEDIGKGFANEHRGAVITQISFLMDPVGYAGCVWTIPMP
jgi:hypothetical protein